MDIERKPVEDLSVRDHVGQKLLQDSAPSNSNSPEKSNETPNTAAPYLPPLDIIGDSDNIKGGRNPQQQPDLEQFAPGMRKEGK